MLQEAVLCFLIDNDEILLASGNYRPGKLTWNGVSGFLKGKEKPQKAAVRTLYEEIKVRTYEHDLEQVGILHLYTLDQENKKEESIMITIFFCKKWQGEPTVTETARPKWFTIEEIPYKDMFQDTEEWLPILLSGQKIIIEVLTKYNQKLMQTTVENVTMKNIFS